MIVINNQGWRYPHCVYYLIPPFGQCRWGPEEQVAWVVAWLDWQSSLGEPVMIRNNHFSLSSGKEIACTSTCWSFTKNPHQRHRRHPSIQISTDIEWRSCYHRCRLWSNINPGKSRKRTVVVVAEIHECNSTRQLCRLWSCLEIRWADVHHQIVKGLLVVVQFWVMSF